MDRFKLNVWLIDDWGRWEDEVMPFTAIKLPFLPRVNDTFNYNDTDYEVIEVNYCVNPDGKLDKQGFNLVVMPYHFDDSIDIFPN